MTEAYASIQDQGYLVRRSSSGTEEAVALSCRVFILLPQLFRENKGDPVSARGALCESWLVRLIVGAAVEQDAGIVDGEEVRRRERVSRQRPDRDRHGPPARRQLPLLSFPALSLGSTRVA